MRIVSAALGLAMLSGQAALANPLAQVSLDGLTRADGIRGWIEIAEPGNLGLLFMGIAGLLIGRWAARGKRKGPPED
ncbi:hypothetical protein [Blastomonas aquatica]|uniref:hypothetical protein n=1 Tax=Blastomonas aquatica TaxID=1510276 RepID=UPI001669C6BB|nr:hypothetical protein [Blastomonas aquatica]